MTREEKFMKEAIKLGRDGMQQNEGGPFGCIIVKGDSIIGRGNNKVTSTNDPTAHAEIIAIREACRNSGNFQLEGCEVYTSCEPCPMCLGAIYWARPSVVYFASTREDAAGTGFDDSLIYQEMKADLKDRKIPMVNLSRLEANQIFQEWTDKKNKVNY